MNLYLVKLVGGGRDKDYGYLGFSHWAEEDTQVMSVFKNIQFYKPEEFTKEIGLDLIYNKQPSYLNLSR
jgi:hypothetical protein